MFPFPFIFSKSSSGVSLPTPDVYWPFDESGDTDDALDAVASLDLNNVGSPDAMNTDKHFSGLDYWREIISGSHYFRNLNIGSTYLDYSAYTDWAIAFWFRPAATGTVFLRAGDPVGNPRCIISETSQKLRARLTMTSITDLDISSVASMVDDTWHSCIVQIDGTGNEFSLQLDDETPVTADMTGGTVTSPISTDDFLVGAAKSFGASGMAIFSEYVFDTQARSDWWNSGSGYYWNGSIWVSG